MDNRQCCTPGKVDVSFASLVWTLLGQVTAAAREAWKESQGSECWHAWSISSYKKLQLLMKTCSKSETTCFMFSNVATTRIGRRSSRDQILNWPLSCLNQMINLLILQFTCCFGFISFKRNIRHDNHKAT